MSLGCLRAALLLIVYTALGQTGAVRFAGLDPNSTSVGDGGPPGESATDGAGRSYDIKSGKLLVTLSSDAAAIGSVGHGNIVQAIAFSADVKRLITGSWDRTAVIWDAATGRPLIALRGHTDKITGLAFAGQSRVITGSADGTACIWDIGAGSGEETLAFPASEAPLYTARTRVTRRLTPEERRKFLRG